MLERQWIAAVNLEGVGLKGSYVPTGVRSVIIC